MLSCPIPDDEPQRLAGLQRYGVLDTLPEPGFDRLTQILRHVLGVPTVLVSLIDADRQWFKSRIGLDATETPRDISFCGHAVYQRDVLVVPDARADPRFHDNPLVVGPLGLRFYAGAPLITADGLVLGTICAIDYVPREAPTPAQIDVMRHLADAVVDALELRAAAQAQAARAKLSHRLGQVAATAHHATDMSSALEPILAELCGITGSAIGHVFLRDSGLCEGFVSSGTWHVAPATDRRQFEFLRDSTRPLSLAAAGPDLFGRVFAEGAPVLATDLDTQPCRRARNAHAAGLRSALVFAIQAGGRIHGIVECYGEHTGAPAQDLLAAADYVGAQLGRLAERERVERLKAEFVSTVSHELRTPLTSIAGALELVHAGVTGTLPPQAKEMVRIAHQNSQRLIRLVNDILDIEKIESGRMSFDLAPLALAPLVERAVSETRAFGQSLGVRLGFETDAADAMALVDIDRFIQVMTNLLSNAAKFSPSGQAVSVTLARRDGGLRVSVADRGPGIPEDFRGRIFEKFAQADGADNKQCAGTGLGLAIVKKIVGLLDGEVSFDSSAGKGTVFHVDLPEWQRAMADTSMEH
jgi:signal transduction histidine kinase